MAISIHVPREGHDASGFNTFLRAICISIHVPREGHDLNRAALAVFKDISIHVPREGHDEAVYAHFNNTLGFQSTCPARGTTQRRAGCSGHLTAFQSTCPARGTTTTGGGCPPPSAHFNPRAPRGARPHDLAGLREVCVISIHVPREGHDRRRDPAKHSGQPISIHVPREGHDTTINHLLGKE